MNAHFLSAHERKQLLAELQRVYGVDDVPYLFLETNKERLRAFSGDLTREEIMEIDEIARIELVGTYFAKPEYGLRLSFDMMQLIGKKISKSIL